MIDILVFHMQCLDVPDRLDQHLQKKVYLATCILCRYGKE